MLPSPTAYILLCYFCIFCTVEGTNGDYYELNETAEYKCANGSAKSNSICLMKNLLRDYDKNVRPVAHHSNQTTVYISIFPLSISTNDYYQNLLAVPCWVTMKWEDELLKWDPKEYQNLDEFNTDTSMIWQPDIKPLAVGNQWMYNKGPAQATVAASGTVITAAKVMYYPNCDLDFTDWPYDKHVCVVILSSRTLRGPALNIFFMKHKMPELAYFKPSKDWELLFMNSSRKFTEIYDNHFVVNIELIFVIQRHASAIVAATVVPAFVLVVTQLAITCLDVKSSPRLILCLLSILCHCGMLQALMSKIRYNGSETPLIVNFYKHSLMLVCGGFVWTVLAGHMSSMTTSPYWLYVVASRARNNRFLRYLWPDDADFKGFSSQDNTEDESSLVAQSETSTRLWHSLAVFLDRMAVITICLLYFIIIV